MSGDKKHKTQIILAVIGIIGSLGVAIIANWDNLFSSNENARQDETAIELLSPEYKDTLTVADAKQDSFISATLAGLNIRLLYRSHYLDHAVEINDRLSELGICVKMNIWGGEVQIKDNFNKISYWSSDDVRAMAYIRRLIRDVYDFPFDPVNITSESGIESLLWRPYDVEEILNKVGEFRRDSTQNKLAFGDLENIFLDMPCQDTNNSQTELMEKDEPIDRLRRISSSNDSISTIGQIQINKSNYRHEEYERNEEFEVNAIIWLTDSQFEFDK